MGDYGATVVQEILQSSDQLLARLEAALSQGGLSVAKYSTLSLLADAENARLPLSVLAEKLACARSNVTGLIDRLEAEGLVRRSSSPEDGRITYAEITDPGRARLAAAQPSYVAALHEALGGLSPAEQDDLVRLLQKLGGRA